MLADYLGDVISLGVLASRTRMRLSAVLGKQSALLMRGLHTVVVDEADSVLIDEATTPLIISSPEENSLLSKAVQIAKEFIDSLEPDVDYLLDTNSWGVRFTHNGEENIDAATQYFPSLWHHRGALGGFTCSGGSGTG